MPQGVPTEVPADGLTTRQRRRRPLVVVHTGPNKGKSTAAFGMALRQWTAGADVAVVRFVSGGEWAGGEETRLKALGELHASTGQGGPVEWHKMGEGWSWSRKAGSEEDHADAAREGWAELRRRLEAGPNEFYVLA